MPDSDISGHLEFEDDDAKKIPKPDGPDQQGDERRIALMGEPAMGEGQATATIDENGAFQLKKVAAGKYRVQVSWGGVCFYAEGVKLQSPASRSARRVSDNRQGFDPERVG